MANDTATISRNDAAGARLDLGATLLEALRGLPVQWRGAGGVLATTGVATIVAAYASGLLGTIALVFALMAGLAALGATTRIGVAGALDDARALGLGPSGFQATRVEARLLGAGALCLLFMLIMLCLLALVALALFGGAGLNAEAVRAGNWAAVGPAWKLVLLAIVGLTVLGSPVVLAVRLSLFASATVGRNQMISLTVTGLSNGAIWPLFCGLVICGLPGLIGIIGGSLLGAAWPVVWLLALVGLQAPLTAGFLGGAYRRLERDGMLGAWQ